MSAPDVAGVGTDAGGAFRAGAPALASADVAAVAAQLGRPPRAIRDVAHRCPCGNPDVIETFPRLADGTPFPTLYYLTCPRAASAIGTLEASGLMSQWIDRLRVEPELAAAYRRAHDAYLARRGSVGHVPEIEGISAGGMPTRVKCLHVLVGHALAAGPGVNPLGDEALAMLPSWWADGPCVQRAESTAAESTAGEATPVGAAPGGAMSGGAMSGRAMSGKAMSGRAMSAGAGPDGAGPDGAAAVGK